MTELHLPALELAILVPLIGALWIVRLRDANQARWWALRFLAVTLLSAVAAWQDFATLHAGVAHDRWDFTSYLFGRDLLVIDELSAPLLPVVALLYLLTTLATVRTKVPRFSFFWMLISESILMATFSCKEPWGIIALQAVSLIPPLLELRSRGQTVRVFAAYMFTFIALLVIGWSEVEAEGNGPVHSLWAVVPLLAAVFIRCGIIPGHVWMSDFFDRATFGTALLFTVPLTGAYVAIRLVLPIAPDWMLRGIGGLSLATAVYTAGLAIVQTDSRKFFCNLFISHSALVLVGVLVETPLGLTGALCVWLSIILSLGGFGLTLRAIEARHGRLALTEHRGFYEQTPALAVCFVLTGLASVGFPGTFGFVGGELLIDGVVEVYPYAGVTVVLAAALNGIGIIKTYFLIFTGKRHETSIPLSMRTRERWAVLTLTLLILGGGLWPQPGVASRHHAAVEIINHRISLTTPADTTVFGIQELDDKENVHAPQTPAESKSPDQPDD